MAETFTDPSGGSAAMLKIIREATDVSTMTEMLRAQAELERAPIPEQGPEPKTEPPLTVREDQLHERVVYPFQNARIILSGMSEAELDEMEKRVRASFGQGAK
jgi:hypothetical protein